MKNQYVGDVTDACKYALLREFQRALPTERLVMGWMLTDDDEGPDGNRTAYLAQPEKYRDVDTDLFDGIAALMSSGVRTIDAVLERGILGGATSHSRIVVDDVDERAAWFAELEAMAPASSLLFLDPDNGLETKKKKGRKDSNKFVYWDEVEDLSRSRSLVIFQHWRRVNHEQMAADLRAELRARTSIHDVFDVRSPNVLFLVASRPADTNLLVGAAERVADRWPGEIIVDAPRPGERSHAQYPRPTLPAVFALKHCREGWDEGPFRDEDLIQGDLPGRPWGAPFEGGRVIPLPLVHQAGRLLTIERQDQEGGQWRYEEFEVIPLRFDEPTEKWVADESAL
jgi:hypothetical protein